MSESRSLPELSGQVAKTIDRIRSHPLPTDSLQRVLDQADRLEQAPVLSAGSSSSLLSHARSMVGIAALVLIAMSLAFVTLTQKTAWSQVLETVSQQPWMRLTLQRSDGVIPDGEHVEDVTMWFSSEHQAAAFAMKSRKSWVDLEKKDEFRFDLTTGRILVTKLAAADSTAIKRLTALSPFDPNMPHLAGQDLRPLNTRESETNIDGKSYRDFEFQFAPQATGASSDLLTVRVDKSTNQPVQLTINEATFAIDYPKKGPKDVYALGVETNAPISDLRNLGKYFRERPARKPSDYDAVEVRFLAGKVRKWSLEAVRYHFDAGTSTAEVADIEQLNELSSRVYFAGGDKPTNQTPDMDWWVSEVNKLDFENISMGESSYPHGRCYMPYGGIDAYRSLHISTIVGLEGMVELRGPKQSVWLDPERDLIVRRYEYVDQDGSITVWQHDDVIQDKKGTWLATRWRSGSVLQRGDLLSETTNHQDRKSGISTTVHIADITFH